MNASARVSLRSNAPITEDAASRTEPEDLSHQLRLLQLPVVVTAEYLAHLRLGFDHLPLIEGLPLVGNQFDQAETE